MSTDAAPTPTDAAPAQEQPPTDAPAADEQPKADETDWKAEARKWEARAKAKDTAAEKAAEKARLDAMGETERAIAEAEAKGRTAAATDFGKRLAKAEIQTAAATAGRDLGGVFDYLDLSRFVGEDGEPDAKAVETFVNGLPSTTPVAPSFDGGARSPAPSAGDMNQALRRAAGRA